MSALQVEMQEMSTGVYNAAAANGIRKKPMAGSLAPTMHTAHSQQFDTMRQFDNFNNFNEQS